MLAADVKVSGCGVSAVGGNFCGDDLYTIDYVLPKSNESKND